jgi:hypothetical protein
MKNALIIWDLILCGIEDLSKTLSDWGASQLPNLTRSDSASDRLSGLTHDVDPLVARPGPSYRRFACSHGARQWVNFRESLSRPSAKLSMCDQPSWTAHKSPSLFVWAIGCILWWKPEKIGFSRSWIVPPRWVNWLDDRQFQSKNEPPLQSTVFSLFS